MNGASKGEYSLIFSNYAKDQKNKTYVLNLFCIHFRRICYLEIVNSLKLIERSELPFNVFLELFSFHSI